MSHAATTARPTLLDASGKLPLHIRGRILIALVIVFDVPLIIGGIHLWHAVFG